MKKNSRRLQGQRPEKVRWSVLWYPKYILLHQHNANAGKAKPRKGRGKQKGADASEEPHVQGKTFVVDQKFIFKM